MDKYYYKKIYCECLNEALTDERYLPVKDYLYKIVKHYSESSLFKGCLINPNGSAIDDFMSELLELFDYIMKENKDDKLDKYIDLLCNLDLVQWFEFAKVLSAIVFKEERFENKKNYYDFFFVLTRSTREELGKKIDLSTRIAQILVIYKKYRDYLVNINIEGNFSWYFELYATLIAANFYKTNLEVEKFDQILAKFTYNISDIYEKYALNGISDLGPVQSSLGFEGENEFAKYFINNSINPQERIIK